MVLIRRVRSFILTMTALVVFDSCASADFVVFDDFSNPSPGQFFVVNPPSIQINPLTMSHPTGLGGTRNTTIQVDVPNPLPAGLNAVTGFLGGGTLDVNSSTFAQVRTILNYTSNNRTIPNFFHTGDPNYLYFSFLSLDPGIDLATNSPASTMPVDVSISTTGGTLSGSFLFAQSASPVDYRIAFADLAGVGDLSQVLSMTFQFNAGPNQRQRTDFVVDSITYETAPVPLPPTALLALAATPALVWLRQRRST